VLERILKLQPGDPVALLALARVLAGQRKWEALAELSAQAGQQTNKVAALDFHRLAADALWTAGELDRAVVEHDKVLGLAPGDKDALAAKEAYLSQAGRHAELVGFLTERAEAARDDDHRLELWSRAALLAEREVGDGARAIALWEKHAELPAGRLAACSALERLYAAAGDTAGVSRALEGQLALVRDRSGRIELLRRLGDHAAHRSHDDARAESAWKELLSLLPEDRAATDELSALQRRRGDYEGLDRTLTAQGWRAADEAAMLGLWRTAAANVEEHLADPGRAAAAWRRVIDLSPADAEALSALARHRKNIGPREAIFALEDRLRALHGDEPGERIALALELGQLHESAQDQAGARAAYERVLAWDPRHAGALEALTRLYRQDAAGVAIGMLDAAAAHESDGTTRLDLARRAQGLVAADDHRGQVAAARRVLWLSGRETDALSALAQAAARAGAWVDLAAVLELLAADDPAQRAQLTAQLAGIVEDKLGDKNRAFVILQQLGQDPAALTPALEALGRLAAITGRHEDHLALLGVIARADQPTEVRRAALRQRAAICEQALNDPERAFHEQARLLILDPTDAEAFAEARRLATARALWHKLDALCVEVGDQVGLAERITLLRERHGIWALRLEDPGVALDLLLTRYRLEGDSAELREQLLAAAATQKAYDRVLPLLEARERAAGASARVAELARLAELHEKQRKDPARALELYAEAFLVDPADQKIEKHLERLSEGGATELLAQTLRTAAARTSEVGRRLGLLRKVAGLTVDALDVHRRILQLDAEDMASLEVIIDRERQRSAWQPLREALERWIQLTAPGAAAAKMKGITGKKRVERLLEIAQVSREHLADPETALTTYAKILELDAENEAALAGVRSLTEGQGDPVLEARRLRLQLARAKGQARVELQLQLARLHEEEQGDLAAAILVLQGLVAEAGAAGPGFEPLARLLTQAKDWAALLDLHEARAQALAEGPARVAALRGIIQLAELHPDGAPEAALARVERLCRRLLDERPGDDDGATRLKTLYRASNRLGELAEVIERELAVLPPSGDGGSAGNDDDGDDEARAHRGMLEDELARLYDCGLGKLAEAEKVQIRRLATGKDNARLPALASLRLRQGDFAGYVERRLEAARAEGGVPGALVLCHLAEAMDEHGADQQKVADLYREARQLDASCAPANEALKAIGRRSKNWRQSAALLAEPDEAKLSWSERALRLKARGDALLQAQPDDAEAARAQYQRAVAVDPDCHAAWDALAELARRADDAEAARQAGEAALGAYERATPPASERLHEHAERIQRLATARAAAGDQVAAARWSRRAYELSPSSPAAALAMADLRLAEGDSDGALAIYDRVLAGRDALSAKDRLHALYQRGALALAQPGRTEAAIADLRDALRLDPLHAGALNTLATALDRAGRDTAAIQHYVQSLLVAGDDRHRGRLLAQLANLWTERLNMPEEGDACVERALGLDAEDRDLLRRGLALYARQGRAKEALGTIEKLLPGASDGKELASLWTSRGELLAAEPERAIEAFDMALSYDPGAPTALAGLARLLEARGEWAQLLDIFEARTESGTLEERAQALRQLARIAGDRLHDRPRAEKYLQGAIDLAPEPADYEQLLGIYGDDPSRERERRDVIAGLLATSGPWAARLGDLGKRLAEAGDRRLAWCLTSPLAGFSIPDAALKSLVLELRKELEKLDNLEALSADTHERVRPPLLGDVLMAVLAEVDEACALGPTTPDELGAQAASKADVRTALGKTFAALAERLGLPGAVLWRAGTLQGAPCRVLDTDTVQIVVRSELLQLLPRPENNFLFVSLLQLGRPGPRLVASLGEEDAARLLPAILAAAPGGASADPAIEAMAARLRAAVDDGRRTAWADRLRARPEIAGDEGVDMSRRLHALMLEGVRRVALVGTPDLRTVARLLTRMDDGGPRQPSGGPLPELDAFFAAMPTLRALLGYAASVEFGRVLSGL
jgi:tetratricopeptide (TPR) repeat protein